MQQSPHQEQHRRPYRSACFKWVPSDDQQLEAVERSLLRGLTYKQQVLAGINTIASTSPSSSNHKCAVVLLHGFAGGLGVWAQNWASLAEKYTVYAMDLPGFARSTRDAPAMPFVTPEDAMSYYEQHLDRWFHEASIPNDHHVVLVGHSFGAYIAAQYVSRKLAVREQIRTQPFVHHLILADPWGVPAPQAEDLDLSKLPLKFRMMMKAFYAFHPLTALRLAGPWGPGLLPKLRPDFAGRWDSHLADPLVFYDYTFHCNARSPPTGEAAFRACCVGRGYALQPLSVVLPERFRAAVDSPLTRDILPAVTVLYGDDTWMTKSAGFAVVKFLRETLGMNAKAAVISSAGHQLNTDNASEFNAKLSAAIDGTLSSEY